jgi:hypothetical protein
MINYSDIEAANWSLLKNYFRSPAHVKYAMDNPREQTDSMALGTLLHMAILEPHKLKDVYSYTKLDGRTKAGIKQQSEINEMLAAGVTVAAQSEVDTVSAMASALFANSTAKKIVTAVTETEKVLQAELLGLPCKGLADFFSETVRFAGDIKTTAKDARFFSFQSEAAKYHYFGQATFYMRLCAAMGIPVDAFFFLVIESAPPHGVCVYQLSEVTKSTCDIAIDGILAKHKACLATNYWPAYSESLEPLEAPDYYYRKMESMQ